VYKAGCRELTFQLLGSPDVDETFRGRLDAAVKITPSQMRVVATAMERAVGETALKLESQMIVLATAVSGAPFLGLLGTVWGVMDTFGDVAAAGSANLAAMAPGVSAALITTGHGPARRDPGDVWLQLSAYHFARDDRGAG
jgi:biopolymer transport protein ExbB/TolQ